MCAEDQPSISAGVRNWRDSNLPFWLKLAVAAKNTAKKAATVSDCCGNYGEPGC
jgi:hypothetical protein